jgi:hypothetical protein
MSAQDIYVAKNYSFELHPAMLKQIGQAFDVEQAVARFAGQIKGKSPDEIEKEGRAFFTAYGRDWINLAHKLGDEYPDRTYEVLLEIIDKSKGYYKFSLLPQRFLEIAYLATMDMSVLPIVENNAQRLIYRIVDCKTYKNLKEKCGDAVAEALPCRHACLTACETIHQALEVDAAIHQETAMPKEGYCEFWAQRA